MKKLCLILFFVAAYLGGSPVALSAAKTAAELKAYFQSGKRPTQSHFEDLIDSMYLSNGDNFPDPLPAVDGSALTSIPTPDPLPAVDGSALTGIITSEWQAVSGTPNYATATSFVFSGDKTSFFINNIRVRLTVDGSDFFTDVVSFNYVGGGTDTTTVNIVDNFPGVSVTACWVSVFTPHPNGAISPLTIGLSAANTPFTPAGTIAATDVQAAIAELDSENSATTTPFTPTGTIASSNVQSAIAELDSENSATTTPFTPTGTIAASNVQAAIAELDSENSATTTPFTPTGTISSSNVQSAIAELDGDVSIHTGASSAHGVSGNVVGTSDSQTLTNKTFNLSSNTLSGTSAQFNSAASDGTFAFTGSGSWTPQLSDNASTVDADGQTYTTQTGSYYSVGNLVFAWGVMTMSSLGTLSGAAYLHGLPFTPVSDGIFITKGTSLSVTAGDSVIGDVSASSDAVLLRSWDSATGVGGFLISDMTSTSSFEFSFIFTK